MRSVRSSADTPRVRAESVALLCATIDQLHARVCVCQPDLTSSATHCHCPSTCTLLTLLRSFVRTYTAPPASAFILRYRAGLSQLSRFHSVPSIVG